MKKHIFCLLLVLATHVWASTDSTKDLQPGETIHLSHEPKFHYYYINEPGTYSFEQEVNSSAVEDIEIIVNRDRSMITEPIIIKIKNLNIHNLNSSQPIIRTRYATDVTLNVEGTNLLHCQNDNCANPVIRLMEDELNTARQICITGTGMLTLKANGVQSTGFVSSAAIIGKIKDTLIVSGTPTIIAQTTCKKESKPVSPSIIIGKIVLNSGTLMPAVDRGECKNLTFDKGAITCTTFLMTGGSIPRYILGENAELPIIASYGTTGPAAYPSSNASNSDVFKNYSYFGPFESTAATVHITGGMFHGDLYCSGFSPNANIPSACIKSINTSSAPPPDVTADANGLAIIPNGYTLNYATPNDEGAAIIFGIPAVATENGMTAHYDFGFTHIRIGTDTQPISFTLAVKLPDGITEDRVYHITITETFSPTDPSIGASRIIFADDVSFSFNPDIGHHAATVSTIQTYAQLLTPASRFFRATVTHAYTVKALPAVTRRQ